MKQENARLYKADMREEPVFPANDNSGEFTLDELQKLVGGSIELVTLEDGKIMVINENGKAEDKPINKRATQMAFSVLLLGDWIAGDAVVIRENQIS